MHFIAENDLQDISIGAAILGTGGGGDPRLGMLIARNAIRQYGPVRVVDVDELDEADMIVPMAMMGAPTVANEKLPSLGAMASVVDAVTRRLGATLTHTMAIEIGGIAALLPIAAAAQLGVPVVDGDMMGRAFPELQMVIPSLLGLPAGPMSVADEWGNLAVLECHDNASYERMARALCVEMGASALIALYPVTGSQAGKVIVRNSLSLAARLGAAVTAARASHADAIDAIITALGGFRLFAGKVTDLARRTTGGFTHLEAQLDGIDGDRGERLTITSQNEHLLAQRGDQPLATTPDLIIVLDLQTGAPITTEALRYGVRVAVIAAPCDPRYRTSTGLAVVGPRAFGYDLDYLSVEDLARHRADGLWT